MVGAVVTELARDLLHLIESYGGRVEIVDGEAHLRAPYALPDSIVDAARDHRSELLALVTSNGAPTPIRPLPDLEEARQIRAAWAGAARELGELCGYPELRFAPARSVAPGEALWGRFVQSASVPALRLVVAELRQRVAELPSPAEQLGAEN